MRHFDGIAAYCDHTVRFGVVESINTTIEAILRRARGMRDEEMLVLTLKWATASPSALRATSRGSSLMLAAFESVKSRKMVRNFLQSLAK